MTVTAEFEKPAIRTLWREPGVWIALVLGLAMMWNTYRAAMSPDAFSAALGLPVAPGDVGFVHVYALRAFALGLIAFALVAARELRALGLFALCAVPMPLGDAILTASAGAETGTVIRHVVYVVVLLACVFTLRRHIFAARG
jgi:hypothetical protein